MNILVFTYDYPYCKYNNMTFVKQLLHQFAARGHQCHVISPYPVLRKRGVAKEITEEEKFDNNGSVTVYRPNYLTIPFLKIGSFYPSNWLRTHAINRAVKSIPVIPDVIYCHFWVQGLVGYKYAQKWKKPLFVVAGESNIASLLGEKKVPQRLADSVKGVICVSSKSRDESIALNLTTLDKCLIAPNAIDVKTFHKLDKKECREVLGLPQDKFIVCFVGWFIERKGPLRVSQAIEKLNDNRVCSLFVGEGEQTPEGEHILYKGRVPHDKIKYYLNASDVFVLPTLNEGCCNAVVEAMACGLPVISSDMEFNKDILNQSNSILIKPNDIDEISEAIRSLADDEILRDNLAKGALATAEKLTIDKRAEQIIQFINDRKQG